MALATRCPHCGTTFRVASDQLKLRGGIVRCGACQQVFDGNASLVDLDQPAAPAAAPAHTAPQEPPATPAEATPAVPAHADDVPVYTLDLDATLDPLGILPKPADDEPMPDHHEQAVEAPAPDATESMPEPGPEPEPEPEAALEPAPDASPEPEPPASTQAPAGLQPGAGAQAAFEPVPEAPEPEAAVWPEPSAGRHPEPQEHDEPAATAPPAEHHRTVFSMGSALLDEPEPRIEPVVPELQAQGANEPVESEEPAAARVEPSFDLPVDEELVAAPAPDAHAHREPLAHDEFAEEAEAVLRAAENAPPLPVRESADVHFAPPPPPPAKSAKARLAARRSKLTPTKIAPPKLRVPEIDEPEFVKRGRQREQWGKRSTILLASGALLLLIALAMQGVYIFRDVLSARYPALRPAVAAVCSVLRCRVELPAQIDNLVIETGELQTLGPDTYQLTTLLRNQGTLVQAWPHIELALTGAGGKPLLRRVFKPSEYLPHGVSPAAGFAARTEQPVRLYFQLEQLKPSDYHIAVFYP